MNMLCWFLWQPKIKDYSQGNFWNTVFNPEHVVN